MKFRNMKKIALAVIAVAAVAVTARAQMPDGGSFLKATDIEWSSEMKMNSDTTGVLIMKMDVAPGWHMYGPDVTDGPRPLEFDFSATTGIEFIGEPQPSVEAFRTFDDMFGVEVTEWDTAVDFVWPFKVTDSETAKIRGRISYQGCNDARCTMPQKKGVSHNLPKAQNNN